MSVAEHIAAVYGSFDRLLFWVCVAEHIAAFPQALEAEDIEDFCALAQHFSAKTPQSFKRVSGLILCPLRGSVV